MTLLYADPETAPPRLGAPWPDSADRPRRRNVRRAAALPLGLLLGVQWLFLVSFALPETAALPARSWWLTQLRPVGFVAGHRLSTAVLLVVAGVLFGLSRSRRRDRQLLLVIPAGLGVVTAVVVGLHIGLGSATGASTLAGLLLLVWVLAAGYAACYAVLVDLGPPSPVTRRSGSLLLAAWIVLLPGPLALARLLLARDLRAEAAALSADRSGLSLAALLSGASVRLYLFGAVAAVVVWLAYQCWPRRDQRRSWRWYAALALAVVVTTQLWWTSQTSAARRVTQLELGTPAKELRGDCATWVFPPAAGTSAQTPTLTVSIGGRECATLTTFAGYHQRGSTAARARLAPVALRAAPGVEDPVSRPGAPIGGARYGKVLVLATTARVDRAADGLIAVPLGGGPPRWRFRCPGAGAVSASFPGGQHGDSTVVIPGEPDPVVLVGCSGQRLRLDPATGVSR